MLRFHPAALDQFLRFRFGVGERLVGAHHDFRGAGDFAQEPQCPRVVDDGVEIEPAETFTGIGILPGIVREAVLQSPQHHRQRAAAMRDDEVNPGISQQVAGQQESRDRNRAVRNAPDGIHETVGLQAVVVGAERRMDDDRCLEGRGGLPERIEVRVIEHAADALGLGPDHRAVKPRFHGLREHLCGKLSGLHRHGGERHERVELRDTFHHVLVDEPAPVGALVSRQFVAEYVEPAGDELLFDPLLREAAAAPADIAHRDRHLALGFAVREGNAQRLRGASGRD